jgi:hypothetical protein
MSVSITSQKPSGILNLAGCGSCFIPAIYSLQPTNIPITDPKALHRQYNYYQNPKSNKGSFLSFPRFPSLPNSHLMIEDQHKRL